jgi:UDP-N-acetylglucosamine--N-acetylmuramyl-(pentapeptide) pyrophosphoryl-undecaprenol N-acetylglucosamine transferase
VYPALAVLSAARGEAPGETASDQKALRDDLQVLWVGSEAGMEAELVKRAGLAYQGIPAAGVHGVGWRALPGNIARLWRGFLASRRILREFRPDMLFFTGGYVAVPMAVAGRIPASGRPRPRMLLFVPDIEPGLALKVLARLADRIAVIVEASLNYLPRRVPANVTGYPTRPELAGWDKASGRQVLGLKDDLPVLLVFGGSSGARSINRALFTALPELLSEMQVVHISGRLDWTELETVRMKLSEELSPELMERYKAFPYLHEEMGAALASADLVLSRSGASCLGEFPLYGLPAVLVPYPYAWRYQTVNAQHLEERGAAVIVSDEDLPRRLVETVRELFNDRQKLGNMGAAMRSLAKPNAAQQIAGLLGSLATSERGAR